MGVCDVPVVSSVCNTAGDAAGDLMSTPFDWLAGAMGGAAKWLVEGVWKVLDDTTYVDVTSSGYTKVYDLLFGVAVFVMLGFFLLQVIGAMIRREPAALSRGAFGLGKSILGSFILLALVAVALEVTDQICVGIVHATGTSMDQLGDRLALLVGGLGAVSIAAPGAGAIVTIFLAILAIGAAVLVWISLLVRKALLLIAIVFAPFALAGASWDHTRAWVSRWASFVLAMIISKVVVVVIFLLATAQVSAPIDADLKSVSQPIAGIVLMLIAGFAPYIAYKAISFMGFDMYHAMSAEQEAKGALNRPMPLPTKTVLDEPRKILDRGSSVGSSPGGGNAGRTPPGGSPGAPTAASPKTSAGTGSGGAGGYAAGTGAGSTGGAAGGTAAGVGLAVSAGRKLGSAVRRTANEQAAPGESVTEPTTIPPQVADTRLESGRTNSRSQPTRGDRR